MHIAIVTGSYHGNSGVSTHVRDLSYYLGKAGHIVTVFAPDIWGEDRVDNVRFVAIRNIPFIPQIPFYLIELFRQRRKTKIDVVHVHDSMAFFAAYFFSKAFGVPTVFTFHASIFSGERVADYNWLTTQIYKFTNRFVARNADMLICISQEMARCAGYAGASEDQLVIIPNLIDLSIFHLVTPRDNGYMVCLYVGSLRPSKGVRYLLQALPEVLKHVPDLNLTIVGDGPERQALKMMSRQLGLDGVVRFIGYVRREEVVQYYQQARLFVTPTLREAQGIVVLEAMACGLPVVASKVGGIPEMVRNGKNGLLVPPGDPTYLAKAIIRLLTEDELYRECSANAMHTAKEFSWQGNIGRFAALFQSLSQRGQPDVE